MKKVLTLALAGLMTLSLAGCGSSEVENKLVVGTAKMNGDFVEGTGNNSYDKNIRDLIHGYNPVVLDEDGVLQWQSVILQKDPEIEVKEDGSEVYTVTIREDLKWNDGEPVTADDYVLAYMLRASKAWIDMGASDATGEKFLGYAEYNAGETGTFAGVKKLSDYSFSVEVRAEELPYYWDKSFVWVLPMPKHYIAADLEMTSDEDGTTVDLEGLADVAEFTKDDYMKNPTVTCGPYSFISFKNQQVQLELNENFIGDYRGEKPSIQTIVVKALNSDKDVDTLIAGEVDLVEGVIEGEKIDKAKADSNIQVSNYARNGYGNIPVACYYGATQDVNVRQAIAYLIDTNKIATAAMGSYGYPCYSDYGAAQKVYIDNKEWVANTLNTYAYNVDAANEALDKSDYKYESDGVTPFDASKASENYLRYNSNGEVLTIKHFGTVENPITDNIKLQLTENAPKAGIKYESTIKDFDTLLTTYYAKANSDEQYNIYNMATGFSEVPDPYLDYHGKWAEVEWYNGSGINDPELNACIEALRSSSSEEEYEENWKAYQVRWNYLLPMIPTYTNDYYDFANVKVEGFKTTPFRNWANEICLYSIKGA